ncbi:MAG TPA: YceI family protein [Thermoanaerobaculia bacterium]|jgi:polyisoprenoid-binding protein YceI|nr:YceI family protein [Thermoanaerobaculia bacterium]
MKHVRNLLFAAAVAAPLLAQTPAPAPAAPAPARETWTVDKVHSGTAFRIRHLMSNVTGRFKGFDAKLMVDRGDPARSTIEFNIQAATIDTSEAARDEHLRSPDFFEAAKYPTISFKSAVVTPKGPNRFDVTGDLTMHGVTRRVTLPVEFLGFGKDARGNERAGFLIETTLDRKDYGITWNRVLDEGGVLLGDEVKVTIDLQMVKNP